MLIVVIKNVIIFLYKLVNVFHFVKKLITCLKINFKSKIVGFLTQYILFMVFFKTIE